MERNRRAYAEMEEAAEPWVVELAKSLVTLLLSYEQDQIQYYDKEPMTDERVQRIAANWATLEFYRAQAAMLDEELLRAVFSGTLVEKYVAAVIAELYDKD